MTPDTLSAPTAFQQFDVTTHPSQGVTNVAALRAEMHRLGLDGFIVPHEDEHQNEYLPDANERLAWVSGFTGSAGSAIVFLDRAILYADGRYTLQSREQTDRSVWEVKDFHGNSLADDIAAAPAGSVIGYDAALISPTSLNTLLAAAAGAGVELKSLSPNPLDVAWGAARPSQPAAPIVPQPLEFAGVASVDKRGQIARNLKANGLAAALITAPSSLAWLFNIRGGDVIRSPLPLGQAVLKDDGSAELFIQPTKITDCLLEWLGNEVSVRTPAEIETTLAGLACRSVLIDAALSSAFWLEALTSAGAKPFLADDPCMLPKACKNPTEIAGTKAAHVRDGAVLTEFLYWVATEAQETLPTEIEVAKKLESLRIAAGGLKDLSFDTISGFGPHGALPHYRVTTASDLRIAPGNLLLVDSGAQFADGTTDVTRTMAIGTPTAEHKRMFTLVLKGHIALATAKFPAGTTGTHLDILARQFLWAEGFDYDHGTGHGVGVYLGVHEGPQRIAKALNRYALQTGMIVSNEPGFYKEGDFGIRIENLQYVTEAKIPKGGERAMHGFANLTWAPIDRSLIAVEMLTPAERQYMDDYHAEVVRLVGQLVKSEVRAWLEEVCAPL
ncbi:metallopeptidase family M24 family protein [Asticcacaulis biprosthecium C19]|uniref:Metallopeptidase family M24 family protein n=1 Tax=Asticcacaulis biprosthecium C19 TaxID=715226 RepID=F4QKS7_9CAUL|nr:aminopeptidase P family protein [Asticcacaulis biprosthecium]EGF93379.1 metallopeptidase family M24 family protein [Asticcacaulis biprosthecium C19]